MKAALTIAGSDSGGGAGIQADLKTFEAHEVFGTSVLTAVTAQNTVGVQKVMAVPEDMVAAQLASILSDFHVSGAKTGMLFDAPIIEVVASALRERTFPLVVDPVMVATSGDRLLQVSAIQAMVETLFPLATVITPNLHEAALLADMKVANKTDMQRAAEKIADLAPQAWILVKGGHLDEEGGTDLLYHAGESEWLRTEFVPTHNTHGTGCTLSAAIAARLALGVRVPTAVAGAKNYLTGALKNAWHGLGHGRGSLRHHYYHNPKLYS
ncbi:MAG: bifunctional hydroxymethylpyrimidine kinase/phosphomethylpyrimidine kinase [Bacteroidota bacterium]